MKLRSDMTINGKLHRKGSDIPWKFIYPFFLVHMAAFGASGFFLAYGTDKTDVLFLYMHGGLGNLCLHHFLFRYIWS